MCFWFAIQCLVCKPFSISEPAKHVLHTICSTRMKLCLILLFRSRRSTSVAHTAHFCSCWDCLVHTSASCFSFFGRALSLPTFQQSLSFHHPLSKTSRYAENSNPAALIAAVLYFRMRHPCCTSLPSQLCIRSFLRSISDAWISNLETCQ